LQKNENRGVTKTTNAITYNKLSSYLIQNNMSNILSSRTEEKWQQLYLLGERRKKTMSIKITEQRIHK